MLDQIAFWFTGWVINQPIAGVAQADGEAQAPGATQAAFERACQLPPHDIIRRLNARKHRVERWPPVAFIINGREPTRSERHNHPAEEEVGAQFLPEIKRPD